MKVAIAGIIKANLMKGVDGKLHARFVAEVELWRLCLWARPLATETHPTGPAQRRQPGVGSAIVVAQAYG